MQYKLSSSASDALPDVMDEIAAAKYVGVCDKTLRKLRQQNKIPFAQVGGQIRYLRSQLHAWLSTGGTMQRSEGSK